MRNTLTALFEYDAVPGHQRERHDQRRRDQVRRQRPPRRDGHEPAPGAAAGDPERRRRALPDRPGHPGPGEVVPLVTQLDDDVLGLAGDSRSTLGTGGMHSKLQAAPAGDSGRRIGDHRLGQEARRRSPASSPASRSARCSSPEGQTHGARKRWIGLTARPRGHYVVDAGARRALEIGHARACWPSASSRSSATSRRGTSSASATRRPRVRPRPDQLRHRRRPPDPRPAHRPGPPGPRLRPLREVIHKDNLVLTL